MRRDERNQVKVSGHPTSDTEAVDNQAAALAPLGCPRTAAELDEIRETKRLAYLAKIQAAAPQPEPYRGSDALSAKRRAAKASIRQVFAERQHTTEETR